MKKTEIKSSAAPEAIGPYSQALVAGGFVFLSGQIGIDPETKKLRESFEEQVKQIFANVRGILQAAGCSLDDVVRVTIYLKDLGNFIRLNEYYQQQFNPPYPCRTTLAVKEIPLGAEVEMEFMAIK